MQSSIKFAKVITIKIEFNWHFNPQNALQKIWQNVLQNVFQNSKTFSKKSICKVANVSANQRLDVTFYCLQGYLHGNNNNNNNTFNLKGAFQDTQGHLTEHSYHK